MVRRVVEASVIMPARNAQDTIGRALACLKAQEAPFEYEVIVVDDGSTDATVAVAEAAGEPVRVLTQGGLGPAAARNRAVAMSCGRALAFCDADCFPEPGWLAAGVAALEDLELVQGRVLPDAGAERGPYDRTLAVESDRGLWETANLFATRAAFDRVGGFEDWLQPVVGKAMAEDLWFGWRVARTGARTGYSEHSVVRHAVFPRRAADYVRERRRCVHFPEIVAKVPELRSTFLFAGVFLDRRTAALDAALAGLALAAGTRRPWPLAAALPYARMAYRRARQYDGLQPKIALADLAADLVCAWALARGSARHRAPVL